MKGARPMYETSLRMGGVWGWRGILGHINPFVLAVLGEFFYDVVPDGVGLMVVTLGMDDPTSKSEVNNALAGVERAAKQLAQANASFIFLGGLPLSIGSGLGHDKKIIQHIQGITGLPTSASITAAMEALRALSVKKLAVASPSTPGLKKTYKEYLEASGFQVLKVVGPEIAKNSDKMKLPAHAAYAAARQACLEAPEADAIYMPCSSWPTGPAVVDSLERDFGKPVVTSAQAFIWAGLKALHIKEPARGFGRLFQTL